MLREILPASPRYPRTVDLLVVDEAHNVAPAGSGKYAVDSLRTKAIRELAPHCEHRLFLSATPHNGYPESFSALLELLDDQRFARGVRPSDEQLDRAMVRRLKRDLPKRWDGSARFPARVLGYAEVDYSEAEREAHRTLVEYADSRRRRVGKGGRHTVDFVTTLLKKRLFSSPQAFARTVATHLATMDAKEAADEGSGSSEQQAPAQEVLPVLQERLTATSEHEEEYQEAEAEVFGTVSRGAPGLTGRERELLVDLRSWAQKAQGRSDARFAALRSLLDPVLFRPGVDGEPIGPGGPGVSGSGGPGDQADWTDERVKNVFTDRPDLDKVRILVATDSASEGINLQRYCHRILHWEIPWNPNRLEQRNGRVDRHGQKADRVEVTHFVPKGWEAAEPGSLEDELGFLRTAVEKVDRIREDLGSAGDVIAHQVEEKMLGRRAEWAEADSEIASRAGVARLSTQRELNRRVEELAATLEGSRDRLDLTPETLELVVRTGLELAHRKDLIDAEPPEGITAKCFRLPELAGAWASARNAGLAHPVTGVERLVTFDPDAVVGRNDLVLLHLKHRLVDLCLTLLREELWSQGSRLSRVTARVVESDVLRVPAVVAHGRVVITGAEGTRLHEEVLLAGGRLERGSFVRAKEEDIDRWMAVATDRLAPEPVRERLAEMWPSLDKAVGGALQQRANQRFRAVQRDLDRKCEEEVDAIGLVLDELAEGIEAALDDTPHWEQASLFEVREQDQLRQDREALQARLEELPERKVQEQAALRHRYADRRARWFPVAVTFLVPASVKN